MNKMHRVILTNFLIIAISASGALSQPTEGDDLQSITRDCFVEISGPEVCPNTVQRFEGLIERHQRSVQSAMTLGMNPVQRNLRFSELMQTCISLNRLSVISLCAIEAKRAPHNPSCQRRIDNIMSVDRAYWVDVYQKAVNLARQQGAQFNVANAGCERIQ